MTTSAIGADLSPEQACAVLASWTQTLLNQATAGDIGGLRDALVEVNGAVGLVEAAIRRSRELDDRRTCVEGE